MTYIRLICAGLTLSMASVQFNDPDPVYWVAVYTATGLVIAGQAAGRFSCFWSALTIGAALAGILLTASGFGAYVVSGDLRSIFGQMHPAKPYVEQAREFLGLILAIAALTWSYRHAPGGPYRLRSTKN